MGEMPGSPHYSSKKLGPAEVLEEDEIRRLLSTFSRAPSSVRDRALVMLLWRTGLRISEALALELRDVDLDGPAPKLRVRDGKGGNQRTLAIHQEAVAQLERWLAIREKLGLRRRRLVFVTISAPDAGGPMGTAAVREMLRRRAQKAGLGRVHPHAFRATLAVELMQEGKSMTAIRDVLGHSNIAQTDAYLRRVHPQDAIDALLNRGDPDPREQITAALDRLSDAQIAQLAAVLQS